MHRRCVKGAAAPPAGARARARRARHAWREPVAERRERQARAGGPGHALRAPEAWP